VDRDFELLDQHPPRVIVLGPKNFWRAFSHGWQPDRGTERLGMRLVDELLPRRYEKAASIPITRADGDFMDVYVSKDASSGGRER
jgi:hypothetical protein